jgi:RNA 3'-terminal phosphate cyclase-like protein
MNAGGVIDTTHQPLMLLFMVLCPEDVCKVIFYSSPHAFTFGTRDDHLCLFQIRFGQLGEVTVGIFRLIFDFFGVVFKVREDTSTSTVMVSCLGTGYTNMARRAT